MWASTLVLLVSLGNLSAADASSVGQDNSEIAVCISGLMDELSRTAETLDAGKTLKPLSKEKDAVFFFNSKPYTREELTHLLGKIYGSIKKMSIKMDRSCVKVLGPDAAVWIACGKGNSVGKTGDLYQEYLTETWIWQRIEGKWQVVHSHESAASLPSAEKRGNVEKSLSKFASELQRDIPTAENIYIAIEKFLSGNPEIVGSAFAMNPALGRKASFYAFRNGSVLERRGTPSTYDYSESEWYAKSAKTGKPEWSEPYYDIDGAGIFMITCSIPVYGSEKQFLGVITADLAI